MKTIFYLCGLLASHWVMGQTPLDTVVATERAFARNALAVGPKKAFLTYMANSAIMQYEGQLQLAKPVWQKFPDFVQKLCWGPSFAGMSNANDLGYTHGPYYTDVQGKLTDAGHFVTVWQRQPDGRYQFVLDLGADSPAYPQPIPEWETRTAIATMPIPGLTPAFIRAHDQAFADGLWQLTLSETGYQNVLSAEATLYRTNHLAAKGLKAALAMVRSAPRLRYRAMGGQVARSGDVAYAYGTFDSPEPGQTARGLYARIWRHETDRGWRLLVEVLSFTGH